MTQDNPFAKLGALDQQLYQETATKPAESRETKPVKSPIKKSDGKNENASNPAIQQSGKPDIQHASNPAIQTSGTTALQQAGKMIAPDHITATEKVTYRFHSKGKYAIEDIKTILARKYGIKASLEEIAEESILIVYEDLLENKNASKLANRLARTPENKKSS